MILQLIQTDLTFLEVDSNITLVAQGAILIGVVHDRQRHRDAPEDARERGRGRPTRRPASPPSGACSATGRSSRSRACSIILVIAMEIASPGIVSPSWAGVILRTAVPLAILAGCQTLTMLTGGIDLSVGASRRWPAS